MKKIVMALTILALIFPGVAKTEDNYEFVVMGNGPVGDQIGMPMSVAVHKDGSVSVFDASNSSLVRIDQTGKVLKRLKMDILSFASSFNLEAMISDSLATPVSFDVADDDSYFFLNPKGIYKVKTDGSLEITIDFSKTESKLEAPIKLAIHDGKFYVLDQKIGVVEYSSDGKQLRTIGTVGSGSGKFAYPVNFWVGFDGSIVVLDSSMKASESEISELLIMVYSKDGKLLREFGSTNDDPSGGEHLLYMPFTGAITRTDIFLVDISLEFTSEGFSANWLIKQFKLSGDFERIWPIIREDKLDKGNLIKDIILSMDANEQGKLFFSMPFAGKVYENPTVFDTISKSSDNDSLKLPSSAITTPTGTTYVLDLFPPVLHSFDKDGNKTNQVLIKDNLLDMPGFDFALGMDLAYQKGEVLVSTGFRILRLNEKTLEKIDSLDLSNSPMSLDIIQSIANRDKKIIALDGKGNISVFSSGVPFTFDAMKNMSAKKLTDIAIDKDNNILVLAPMERKIGIFSISGSFLGTIDINSDISTPVSIATLPTGEIAVVDAVQGRIVLLASSGSIITTIGSKGMLGKIDSKEDYKAMPGKFHIPSHITCIDEKTFTVTDSGNCRVQVLKSATPPPPDKTPPKLTATPEKLDFGKVYFEKEGTTLTIDIANLGELELMGTVKSGSTQLKISPKLITEDTKAVSVTFVPERNQVWKKFSDKVTIETNGGVKEIIVEASVVGKIIKMTVGDPNFEVTTDIVETVVSPRAPQIISSRTYVPLRATGDVFKAESIWDGKERKVTYKMGSILIELWIGKNEASVNGKKVPLSSPPILLNNSTYVPLRFVSEQLGAQVNWDQNTKTVTITYPTP